MIAESHAEGVAQVVILLWNASERIEEGTDIRFCFRELAESVRGSTLNGRVHVLEGAQGSGLAEGREIFVLGKNAEGVDANVAIRMRNEFAKRFLIE